MISFICCRPFINMFTPFPGRALSIQSFFTCWFSLRLYTNSTENPEAVYGLKPFMAVFCVPSSFSAYPPQPRKQSGYLLIIIIIPSSTTRNSMFRTHPFPVSNLSSDRHSCVVTLLNTFYF